MGDDYQYLDIILFALIAGFLVFRLRSVLGRRTGEERQRPLFGAAPKDDSRNVGGTGIGAGGSPAQGVRPLPLKRPNFPRPPAFGRARAEAAPVQPISPNAAMVERIRQADASFDADAFLGGARAAFAMIVEAFAKGDVTTLRRFLSDDVYRDFSEAVAARERAGETLETVIDAISRAEISDGQVDRETMIVSVRFNSQQTNVVRDAAGSILEGAAARPIEKVDLWTFSRRIGSASPDWLLVATSSP